MTTLLGVWDLTGYAWLGGLCGLGMFTVAAGVMWGIVQMRFRE